MLPFPRQELPGHLDALLRPLAGVPSQVWGQHHRDAGHLAGGAGPAQCCILHLDCLLGSVGTAVHVWVSTVHPSLRPPKQSSKDGLIAGWSKVRF